METSSVMGTPSLGVALSNLSKSTYGSCTSASTHIFYATEEGLMERFLDAVFSSTTSMGRGGTVVVIGIFWFTCVDHPRRRSPTRCIILFVSYFYILVEFIFSNKSRDVIKIFNVQTSPEPLLMKTC